ncbi:hypothetical protein GKZ68_03040 [Hymenobacter sp. BRD128]|uniref:hypothetical protein n=1 Tax=Hymenobacter sp. BRD128 TaxID=2675878 RepID=UPI001566FD19|nr:hypothetical protein [Hymenobacter sp. BRD128]QKG55705.1 hypothetical protein GKZ68_03040 [Hymenobacter sp. BRD128]
MNVFNRQGLYYFTPDGRVYADPTDFTDAGLAAVGPQSRGAFEVNGAEMTVKWDQGAPETHPYKSDPTGFEWNGSFVGIGPFADAKQLVGTFEGHNDAVTVDANSTAVYRTLVFQPDGTFTRDNYAAIHLDSRPSTGADPGAAPGTVADGSASSQQAGHWSLDGWFLTLTDAQGTIRALAFPLDQDDKTDKLNRFRFNSTTYRAAGS